MLPETNIKLTPQRVTKAVKTPNGGRKSRNAFSLGPPKDWVSRLKHLPSLSHHTSTIPSPATLAVRSATLGFRRPSNNMSQPKNANNRDRAQPTAPTVTEGRLPDSTRHRSQLPTECRIERHVTGKGARTARTAEMCFVNARGGSAARDQHKADSATSNESR